MSDVFKELKALYQANCGENSDELFNELLARARTAAKNGTPSTDVSELMRRKFSRESKEFKRNLLDRLKATGLIIYCEGIPAYVNFEAYECEGDYAWKLGGWAGRGWK